MIFESGKLYLVLTREDNWGRYFMTNLGSINIGNNSKAVIMYLQKSQYYKSWSDILYCNKIVSVLDVDLADVSI